jgi:hypothetical protein
LHVSEGLSGGEVDSIEPSRFRWRAYGARCAASFEGSGPIDRRWPLEDRAMAAMRRLCGKTRKMTGRENLDFARGTPSAQVIVTMRRMRGPHVARSPARRSPAEFSVKVVYGRSNCDRREKSSFSTQSASCGHSPTAWRTSLRAISASPPRRARK